MLLLLALTPLAAQDAALSLDDFEGDLGRWGRGVSAERGEVKQGEQAMAWDPAQGAHLALDDIPHDWSDYGGLALWVHNAEANDAQVMLTFPTPDNPATDGGDYYLLALKLDWTGWREIAVPFERLGRGREPLGLERIERIEIHGTGWGQDSVLPGTRLIFDDLRLTPLPADERARRQAARRAAETGSLTPLAEGEALLETFADGGWQPERWRRLGDPLPDERGGVQPLWYGLRLWMAGPGRLGVERSYDVPIEGYRRLLIGGRRDGAVSVGITAVIDGQPQTVTAGLGESADVLAIDFVGNRLQGLSIVIESDHESDAVREYVVEWVALRGIETVEARAHAFANRAALIAWDRPAWGADRYLVVRDRIPIVDPDQAPAIAAGRSAMEPWVIDTPPEAGEWHYFVAPMGPIAGNPGTARAVLSDRPVPTVPRAWHAVVVDGELGEWEAMEGGPPLALTTATGYVPQGEVAGDADLGATVWLAHDREWLYLAADVRDDTVAHRHEWAWMGDALVFMIGGVVPGPGSVAPDYDLVLCYAASEPPVGVVLQDATQVYAADAKPPAPGAFELVRHSDGYRLEAAIPLAALTAFGIDPFVDPWLALGVSLYDSDAADGATEREAVLSWSQREDLYSGAEAGLVRWEP